MAAAVMKAKVILNREAALIRVESSSRAPEKMPRVNIREIFFGH